MSDEFQALQNQWTQSSTEILAYLNRWVPVVDVPIYSSVDIRESAHKMASIDTNLFPAGFNNLCKEELPKSAEIFKDLVKSAVDGVQRIILITEAHTRNLGYHQNIQALSKIIENAGFDLDLAAFFEPELGDLDIESPARKIRNISNWEPSDFDGYDLIILNYDMSDGIPGVLESVKAPIYPKLNCGWHNRSKATHFRQLNRLIDAVSRRFSPDHDPWFLQTQFAFCPNVSVHEQADRERLAQRATELFQSVQAKYDEYGITDAPLLFLKADAGTYGMGVMPIESPEDILSFNRKARNKLSKTKKPEPVTDFILQEGIPSIPDPSGAKELVLYQLGLSYVGSFFRMHPDKDHRANLNAKGMQFTSICEESNPSLPMAKLLGVAAAVASYYEIHEDDWETHHLAAEGSAVS